MSDLSDPAIREAGALAIWLFGDAYDERYDYKTPESIENMRFYWGHCQEATRQKARDAWDRIAAELGPVIQQAEIREQMRGGIDDAGTEST